MGSTLEPFADRREAGRALGAALAAQGLGRGDVCVLGLPRGGVPVAFEAARILGAPLDVFLVRKLGAPGHEELAMGALAAGGVRVLNQETIAALGVTDAMIDQVVAEESVELDRRNRLYRQDRPPLDVRGKTVIVVDDGLATGSTMRAAVLALRRLGPARIVAGAPVAAAAACADLAEVADACVCPWTPEPFRAVGLWYEDFAQTTDEEVRDLLALPLSAPLSLQASRNEASSDARMKNAVVLHHAPKSHAPRAEATIPVEGGRRLKGELTLPPTASGVVVFAHGSGSGRRSPRNQFVADVLQTAGFGTLLLDLLDPTEEHDRARVFDVHLLARRLQAAADWLEAEPATRGRSLGLFGASTGAGAALIAAACQPDRVAAIVSRGGRPDLARDQLAFVQAPTLLIVGARDEVVLDLNRRALERMACPRDLAVVAGASHLFSEPGALEDVARLAASWFQDHLGAAPR